MAVFHLTEAGPRACRARLRPCPFGGDHFSDRGAAQKSYERMLEEEFKASKEAVETVAIEVNFGTLILPVGDLSRPATRHALANGLCGDLAQALISQTGGSPYFVCYTAKNEDELAESFSRNPTSILEDATHVVVESPMSPGKFMDSYGSRTVEDIASFYGEDATLVKGSEAMLAVYSTGVADKLSSFATTVLAYDEAGIGFSYSIYE